MLRPIHGNVPNPSEKSWLLNFDSRRSNIRNHFEINIEEIAEEPTKKR